MKSICVFLLCCSGAAAFASGLGPNVRISSDVLGYDLQYRVYTPKGVEGDEKLAVLFVTDGPAYIQQGRVPQVLDRLIDSARIDPVVAVFVDARDPDDLGVNRRNREFFCNEDYLSFYVSELIPAVERAYPVQNVREARSIVGVSFGGLNAACFGFMGYEFFSGIGMHSPAIHPVDNLLEAYQESPRLPLRIFLSTGYPDDNTSENRRFQRMLRDKGYDMEFVQINAGHDWDNWRRLIDDVLLYFYGRSAPER